MTRGVPILGYRMRTCVVCNELFDPKKEEITYLQEHFRGCQLYEYQEYICGCQNVRKTIEEKLGLDTEEKQDQYYDNPPDCTCKRPKKFVWVCEDCRIENC